jgi:hypothetical protein
MRTLHLSWAVIWEADSVPSPDSSKSSDSPVDVAILREHQGVMRNFKQIGAYWSPGEDSKEVCYPK